MTTTIYHHDVTSVTVKEPRFLDGEAACWSRVIEIRSGGDTITVTLFSERPGDTLPAIETTEVAA